MAFSSNNQAIWANNSDSTRKGVPDGTVPGGTRYQPDNDFNTQVLGLNPVNLTRVS